MNDKSDFEKMLLRTISDKQNMYVRMLDSWAEVEHNATKSCSEKDIDTLVRGRVLTDAQTSFISSEYSFTELKFEGEQGGRENFMVL